MADYLSKRPYTPLSFTEMNGMRALMPGATEEGYQRTIDALQVQRGIEVSDITYTSDGLKITGIEVLPKQKPNEKVPLVIFNRGGSGNFGMLNAYQISSMMVPFAQHMRAGVLASNYRGNGGSEGREEWGGADVNDVLKLIEIGKQQPWWDGKNIFMIGWSRGCMMNYLALKAGVQVNAVVSGAGVSNLFLENDRRPEMEKVCAHFIPNFAQDREALLAARSPIFWPEKITAPLLLLHGDQDDRVDVGESRRLHNALKDLGKPVNYIEFSGGDHGLRAHHVEVIDAAVEWFERHKCKMIEQAP